MRNIFFASLLVFLVDSCKADNCNNIPPSFSSYDEAIQTIKKYSFLLSDSININEKSFMLSANYYSCDKKKGYFFYTRDSGNEYFNSGVPIELWIDFKKADNKAVFYEQNISGKYSSVKIVVDLDKLNQKK